MTDRQLREIFDKTGGHFHFCGDRLSFSDRGGRLKKKGAGFGWLRGSWEVDHVARRAQLGTQSSEGERDRADNRLPACTGCNRLRWKRKGGDLRRIILLGVIATKEIEKHKQNKPTEVGRQLKELLVARLKSNRARRQPEPSA